jgi:hypothetical protein
MFLTKNIHDYTLEEFWGIVDAVEREKREAHIVPPTRLPGILECECGEKFSPKKTNQLYCSPKCGTLARVRIHRERMKELKRKWKELK